MLKTCQRGDVIILELGGMVNVTNTGTIWDEISHIVEDPATKRLAIEMSGVFAMDSSGLGLLVRIAKALQHRDAKLCLVAVSNTVAELLKLTKLIDFFPFARDMDEAARILGGGLDPGALAEQLRAEVSKGKGNGLTEEFKKFLHSLGPSVSNDDVTEFTGAVQRLENFERMAQLLVDAYDTDLKAKAEELAAKRVAVIREVAVGLNHEINNPLTVILATSELLERSLPPDVDDKVIQRLRSIQVQCERVKEIVAKVCAIVKPVSSEYYSGMDMIDVHLSQ